jgi:hypothetical protein
MPVRTLSVAAVLLAGGLIASCGDASGGDVTAVRDADREIFFEIPSDWSVLDESVVQSLGATPFVDQAIFNLPITSRVVFHGPGLAPADTALDPALAGSPVGSAVIRSIPEGARDFMSRFVLAEAVVPYHDRPIATEYLKQDVEIADGYQGVQLLVTYADNEEQVPAAILFVSVTDPTDRTLYSIAVGCSADCFNLYGDTIGEIVDSWLVNTR